MVKKRIYFLFSIIFWDPVRIIWYGSRSSPTFDPDPGKWYWYGSDGSGSATLVISIDSAAALLKWQKKIQIFVFLLSNPDVANTKLLENNHPLSVLRIRIRRIRIISLDRIRIKIWLDPESGSDLYQMIRIRIQQKPLKTEIILLF